MSLAKRIIPCLDVDRGRVVKGTNFVNLRDAGDPVQVAARYEAAKSRRDPIQMVAGITAEQVLADRNAMLETGVRILRLLTAAITRQPFSGAPVHEQLAEAWSVSPDGARLIRAALVLSADHEFNASAFAARVVASTGAIIGLIAGVTLAAGESATFSQPSIADLLARFRSDTSARRFAQGRVVIFGPGTDHGRLFPVAALADPPFSLVHPEDACAAMVQRRTWAAHHNKSEGSKRNSIFFTERFYQRPVFYFTLVLIIKNNFSHDYLLKV